MLWDKGGMVDETNSAKIPPRLPSKGAAEPRTAYALISPVSFLLPFLSFSSAGSGDTAEKWNRPKWDGSRTGRRHIVNRGS